MSVIACIHDTVDFFFGIRVCEEQIFSFLFLITDTDEYILFYTKWSRVSRMWRIRDVDTGEEKKDR